jgi:Flp pilus assembly protein protease CpaA
MEMTPTLIRVALLGVLLLPLLIGNIRTTKVKNLWLLPLLLVGVACALFVPASGVPQVGLPQMGYWLAGTVLFLGLFAARALPGGTAKFLLALIPWFAFGEYMTVLCAGGFLAVLIAYTTRRDALIVPPIMVAALVIAAFPLFGFGLT